MVSYFFIFSIFFLISKKGERMKKCNKFTKIKLLQVLKAGLEGLVLKNTQSLYQPGKRNWLKIKKDYLFEGQMADTADLVVLGAWFGSGKKGGMLSIFLMGCQDMKNGVWKTVTKVHSGLDDSKMEKLQSQLKLLMERCDADRLPTWISCKKQLVPDYLAKDPMKMPVWEITGAEFTKAEAHTANGISIRFPRITRIRDDKDPEQSTNLEELENLFKKSKESVNVNMLFKNFSNMNENELELKAKFFDLSECFNKNSDNGKILKSLSSFTSSSSSERKHETFTQNTEVDDSPVAIKKMKIEEETKKVLSKIVKPEVIQENQCQKDVKEKDVYTKTESSSMLFNGIVAFILPEAENSFKPLIKLFVDDGGRTTRESRNATHALHHHSQNNDDFLLLRQKYQPTCRHLTCKWIEDSIAYEKPMPLVEYAVKL